MIPDFTHSGVLPPFTSSDPTDPNGISPYKITLAELATKFLTSEIRKNILIGFLSYRTELKKLGFVQGFQWIDGSFVEDIEKNQQRPPNDIDIITFADRPASITTNQEWIDFFNANQNIFNPVLTKTNFMCDAYHVDLDLPQEYIVRQSSYWYGLFSHQRETYLWKGLLEISLADNDEEVMDAIINGGNNAS